MNELYKKKNMTLEEICKQKDNDILNIQQTFTVDEFIVSEIYHSNFIYYSSIVKVDWSRNKKSTT